MFVTLVLKARHPACLFSAEIRCACMSRQWDGQYSYPLCVGLLAEDKPNFNASEPTQ